MKDINYFAYNGSLKGVTECIEKGGDVNALDAEGYTALHWNCFFGARGDFRLSIAESLIDSGADVNKLILECELSPLLLAVQSGNGDLVLLLLRHGANPNQKSDGSYPIVQSAVIGDLKIAELLIEYCADVFVKDCHGVDVFKMALEYEHEDIYQALKVRGSGLTFDTQ